MRESIHALRCDLLCFQDTQSERTRSRTHQHTPEGGARLQATPGEHSTEEWG
ncbi:hypothetical protein GBAR_LOCUS29568, partial [Geodia barretti]